MEEGAAAMIVRRLSSLQTTWHGLEFADHLVILDLLLLIRLAAFTTKQTSTDSHVRR